jgi:hypothetical protein
MRARNAEPAGEKPISSMRAPAPALELDARVGGEVRFDRGSRSAYACSCRGQIAQCRDRRALHITQVARVSLGR